MYSSRFFKLVGLQTKIANIFRSCSFYWDPDRELFVYQKKQKLRQFYLNTVAIILGTVYFGIRALQINLWGSPQDFSFAMTLFFCGITNSCAFLVFALHKKEFVNCLNSVFVYSKRFYRYWKKSFRPEKASRSKLLEILFASGICIQFQCPWLVSAHYFMYPEFPVYLIYNALPNNFYSYITLGLLYVLFLHSIFANCVLICNLALAKLILIVTILPTEFIIGQMNDNNSSKLLQSSYKAQHFLRSPQKLFLEYRAIDLLLRRINAIIGPGIIPLQAVITDLCLLSNYTLIRQWDQLDKTTVTILLLWTTAYLSFWIAVLGFGGWLKSGGEGILSSWKRIDKWSTRNRKILQKQAKGCRLFAIRVGSYRCIDRLSVLKFLQGIVEGTFRALLLTTE